MTSIILTKTYREMSAPSWRHIRQEQCFGRMWTCCEPLRCPLAPHPARVYPCVIQGEGIAFHDLQNCHLSDQNDCEHRRIFRRSLERFTYPYSKPMLDHPGDALVTIRVIVFVVATCNLYSIRQLPGCVHVPQQFGYTQGVCRRSAGMFCIAAIPSIIRQGHHLCLKEHCGCRK